MKILVTGPYLDGNSGWAKATMNFALALDKVADVVCRGYKLNQDEPNTLPRIKELEAKSEYGADVVVHCGLPHLYKRTPHALNVGICYTESEDYSLSSWPSYMNLMDKMIVSSRFAVEAAKTSGVKVPVKFLPTPVDFSRYNIDLPWLDTGTYNDFRFLFVGDVTIRKGLPYLIRAFHTEFTPNEPVSLVVKINKYGESPENLKQSAEATFNEIKNGLRLRKSYKKEVIITEKLSDNNMLQLHKNCECIVAPSLGEGWNLPVIDSLALGNTAITTDTGGFREYNTIKVKSYPNPCYGMNETFEGLMTSYDSWCIPDIHDLGAKMRNVYMGDREKDALINCGLTTVGKSILGWLIDK